MTPAIEPLNVDVATASKITTISRSALYELFKTGAIKTKKYGRKTLVDYASLVAFNEGLPDGMGMMPAQLVR